MNTLFNIIAGKEQADSGSVRFGKTIKYSYLPQDNREYFDDCHLSIVDWLRQYSKDKTESYVRGWLGRMLFSGEESLKEVNVLSGGEKALTAIAILFAILKLRPMPFCLLDEIEAALDDANVDRFAQYLRRFSKETQFIVITHRKPTMELADSLYGVTMEEKGVSKIVSVKLSEAVKHVEEAS